MSGQKTDNQLIEEFKNGSTESFELLINRYKDKAYSLASRLTRNQEDAEEVLQDVFVSVYRKIHAFEGKSTFSSWLYRVTVNAALMKIRKRKQDQSVSLEDMMPHVQESLMSKNGDQINGDTATLRAEIAIALDEAIRTLPDEYRPVFVLRDVNGLTSKEVGEILNLTIPAVKSRLHRSRLMMRRKLVDFYQEYQGQQQDQGQKAGNF
ncbi:MAG: sigma-70 family RNA polymerase sigma factor [Candidatus Dadabacteria bacterium]|nr:MAG: sigma-70 family RNA polymerase sigma factor [Candidatus Dadabacteria bacterium]